MNLHISDLILKLYVFGIIFRSYIPYGRKNGSLSMQEQQTRKRIGVQFSLKFVQHVNFIHSRRKYMLFSLNFEWNWHLCLSQRETTLKKWKKTLILESSSWFDITKYLFIINLGCFFLDHLTHWVRKTVVITFCQWMVLWETFHIKIFFSESTWSVWTKLGRNVH
jgi:hypothetical protein